MSKVRWVAFGDVLVGDFRPRYRSELLKPSRTVYRRRSRFGAIRGAVRTPHDIGHVRAVSFRYALERRIVDVQGLPLLGLPYGGPRGAPGLGSLSQAPALDLPKPA